MAPSKRTTINKVEAGPSLRRSDVGIQGSLKHRPPPLRARKAGRRRSRNSLPPEDVKQLSNNNFTNAFIGSIWAVIKKKPEVLNFHNIVSVAKYKQQKIENKKAAELFARLREEKLDTVEMAEEIEWRRVKELAWLHAERERKEAQENQEMAKSEGSSDSANGKRKMVDEPEIDEVKQSKCAEDLSDEPTEERMELPAPTCLVIPKRGERTEGHEAVIRQVSATTGKDIKRQKVGRSLQLSSESDEGDSSNNNGAIGFDMRRESAETPVHETTSKPLAKEPEPLPAMASIVDAALGNLEKRRFPIKLSLDTKMNRVDINKAFPGPAKHVSFNTEANPSSSDSPIVTEASEVARLGRPLTAYERLRIREHNLHKKITYADISIRNYPKQWHKSMVERERLALREVRQRAEYTKVASATPSPTSSGCSPAETETAWSNAASPTDSLFGFNAKPVALGPPNGSFPSPTKDDRTSVDSNHDSSSSVTDNHPPRKIPTRRDNTLTQQNEEDHSSTMHNLLNPSFHPHNKSKPVVQIMIIFPLTDSCDYSIINFCHHIKNLENINIARYEKRVTIDGGFKDGGFRDGEFSNADEEEEEEKLHHTAVFITLDKAVWKIIKHLYNQNWIREVKTIEEGFAEKKEPVELWRKLDWEMVDYEELDDMELVWRKEKLDEIRKRKLAMGSSLGSLGPGGITGLLGRMGL